MILHVEIVISAMSNIEHVFLHVLTGHCVRSLASFLLSSYACVLNLSKIFLLHLCREVGFLRVPLVQVEVREELGGVGSSSAFVWVLRMEVRLSG